MKQNLLVMVAFALAALDAPRRCGRAQRHAENIIGRLIREATDARAAAAQYSAAVGWKYADYDRGDRRLRI
jgi:hypothetical protein